MSLGAILGTAAAVLLGAIGFSELNPVAAERSSGDRPVFVSITPCRVTDTRAGQGIGGRTTPIGEKESHVVNVRPSSGDCSGQVPVDALSVQLNVTALNATQQTFLTLHSTDTPLPTASALNPAPASSPSVNAVTTGISAAGEFTIYNDVGTVNVLIDIGGYYVHHNHDDDRPTELRLGHTEFQGAFGEPDGRFAGTGFAGNAPNQCLLAHIPLAVGMSITELSFSGAAGVGTNVEVGLARVRTAPGTGLSPADFQSYILNETLAGAGVGNLIQTVVTLPITFVPDLTVDEYYAYSCSSMAYTISGVSVSVVYS